MFLLWLIVTLPLGIALWRSERRHKKKTEICLRLYQEGLLRKDEAVGLELIPSYYLDAKRMEFSLQEESANESSLPRRKPAERAPRPAKPPALTEASQVPYRQQEVAVPTEQLTIPQKPAERAPRPAKPPALTEASQVPYRQQEVAVPMEQLPIPQKPAERATRPAKPPALTEASQVPYRQQEVAVPTEQLPIPQKPAERAPIFAESPALTEAQQKPNSRWEGAIVKNHEEEHTPNIPYADAPKKHEISAISVLLAVGAAMIIIAGILFVRSTWESLSAGGRLVSLSAGSVLFFGFAAMAHKMWKLERTGEAFFTIGAALLPISVWAAGVFDLLGSGLSGSGNPWLLSLSAAAFTVVAFLAVRLYRQLGWSISTLSGFSVTYVCLCKAMCPNQGVLFLAIAAFATVIAYTMKPLQQKCKLLLSKTGTVYAMLLIFGSLIPMMMTSKQYLLPNGLAMLCLAAAFFSPLVSQRLHGWTALPVGIMTVGGLGSVCRLLMVTKMEMAETPYRALLFMMAAAITVLILFSERYAHADELGYKIMFCMTAGIAQVLSFIAFVGLTVKGEPLVLAAMLALLLMTALAANSLRDRMFHGLLASEAWLLLCCLAVQMFNKNESILLAAAIAALACGLLFTLIKPLRTRFSDFLFPLMTAVFSAELVANSWKISPAILVIAFLLIYAAGFAFWLFAIEDSTNAPRHFFQSILSLIVLGTAVYRTAVYTNWESLDCYDSLLGLICVLISATVIVLSVRLSQNQFPIVRKFLVILYCLPFPLICVLLVSDVSAWTVAGFLLAALAAGYLWQLCAKWEHPRCGALSFSVMYGMLVMTIGFWFAMHDWALFETEISLWAVTGILLILGVAVSILARHGKLRFSGDAALVDGMSCVGPIFALLFGIFALADGMEIFHISYSNDMKGPSFYIILSLIFSVCAWLTTKPLQKHRPMIAAVAGWLAIDDILLRICVDTDTFSFGLYAAVIVFTTIFCALGILVRKTQPQRAWSLTVLGGMTIISGYRTFPLMFEAQHASYSFQPSVQEMIVRSYLFAYLLLAAAYTAHFIGIWKGKKAFRNILTISAALVTVALLVQPFIPTEDTYWQGKLHLLPLIAFGILMWRLYGANGSTVLFGVGIYSFVRLGLQAIDGEQIEDLFTILMCALAVFVVSFFVKRKRWFLLGGITLCVAANYLRIRIFPDTPWWVFLLLVGILLIAIAAVNETLKKMGDSLTAKAGRLWEDWKW